MHGTFVQENYVGVITLCDTLFVQTPSLLWYAIVQFTCILCAFCTIVSYECLVSS